MASRARDIIDTGPSFTQADADALNARFAGVDAATMLRALFAEGALGRVAVVSSFGTESAVLLHLVAEADPAIPVIFVDTLKMFPETLEYRDTLVERFELTNSTVIRPDPATGVELIVRQNTRPGKRINRRQGVTGSWHRFGRPK